MNEWRGTTAIELVNQKRKGVKVNYQLKYLPKCLIVCDSLPSIVFLFNRASTFNQIFVYVKISTSSEIENVICYMSKLSEVTMEVIGEKEARLRMMDEFTCKIGMGSVDFLWEWWRSTQVIKFEHSILICAYNRLKRNQFQRLNVRWTRLAHKRLGGLTNTTWMIGIPEAEANTSLMGSISNLGLERTLLSIVKEKNHGKIVEAPQNRNHLSFWNVRQPDKMLEIPSFMSRTGWVERSLTLSEKALCLDVNEIIISQLDALENSTLCNWINSGSLIPIKICQVAVTWVLEIWGTTMMETMSNRILLTDSQVEGNSHCTKPKSVSRVADQKYLKFETEYLANYGEKAAKDDDEKVPIELWDRYILRFHFTWLPYSNKVARALEVIRSQLAFRWFLRFLRLSLFQYLRRTYGKSWFEKIGATAVSNLKRKRSTTIPKFSSSLNPKLLHDLHADIVVARDSIKRACGSSWWEWNAGSACYFWRWPLEIRKSIRDGFPIHIEGSLPKYRQRQIFHLSESGMDQLRKKIRKVSERNYIEEGYVSSLINYFAVPKGENDIRVVYDGTKCGLNQSVWAPNFYLPSVDSLLMTASTNTWFSDMDLGEMFLNFYLDKHIRPYAGVDVSKILSNVGARKVWKRWNRTLMGFKSSPYIACKLCGWAVDVARGDRSDPTNPFKWTGIRLNLPGSPDYDPTIPWVCKIDGVDEASDVIIYVDDFRPYGSSELKCRAAAKRVAKIIQYLGLQDAPRKYRPPNQKPGPWCGSFVAVKGDCVWAYVSQKKWDKGKQYVTTWLKQVQDAVDLDESPELEHKPLEQGRGFLVYLSRTYTSIVPYLKGIHLSLDSWRDGRDRDGWKVRMNARRINDEDPLEVDSLQHGAFSVKGKLKTDIPKPPKFIMAVPRLHNDLKALHSFFDSDTPPWRFVRGKTIYLVRYGFGDASKSGFGSTIETAKGISYRYGTWGIDCESKSSNFRELENLAQALEEEAAKGNVDGAEVFLFTDNSTAESAYYKGTSSSKELFYIILRLRKLEMKSKFKIHFVHVAGSRMICQGTDGLSRGDLAEGVMKGASMLSFIPLHLNVFQRAKVVKKWMSQWILPTLGPEEKLEFLNEEGWFWRGHGIDGGSINTEGVWIPKYKDGNFIWSLAPAAGQIAVEQLRAARNKRTSSLHIIIVPRLFTSLWRRQLNRVADLTLDLPFIEGVWEKNTHHEPLTLAFVFPYLAFSPWQLRRTKAFLEMGRMLSGMWKENQVATGFILCKFLSLARSLESMPEKLVLQMLSSPRNFRIFYSQTGK